ncbi:hypothetical protein SAMN05421759_105138 [Roseivivax lentus]|uniref:Histidine kinase-, DNA gyrase B-, and HSP90-like ATPase n=1 Tax=Roseivivax lentus TaxID=633194 RepID=A0A1N7MSU7_9RHOB|nr:ATP-binding protein [Roseivivax lentus]SIS88919.1 hypothetical protein SAMN05421759_105138 [Roseivivax lentus]
MRVILPRQFRAEELFQQVEVSFGRFESIPDEVEFDFSGLRFARPSGIVFLSNLTRFLVRHGCTVRYIGMNKRSDAIRFLDDSQFFQQHLGRTLRDDCATRQTTQPLMEVRHQDSHGWIGFTLVPWLSACSGVPVEQMAEFRTCISELFNNISDHTELDVGSIFAQWYPQEHRLEMCLADFGSGIPATVGRVRENLTDEEAISLAFEDGFTSKSLETNQGVGLYYLQVHVVQNLGGVLSCQSSGGGVRIEKNGNSVTKVPYRYSGYCPGTLIQMSFNTDKFSEFEDEGGEFEW